MNFVLGCFEQIGYIGIFIILLLCGLGLPIPEDITLLAGGYLTYLGRLKLFPTIVVSMIGVLSGDLIIFFLGRKWGELSKDHKIMRKFITPERLKKANHYFTKYGGKTIFFARFLPGIRAATFLTAGFVKMSRLKFFMLDFLASLISVPLVVYLANWFGFEIDYLIEVIRKTKLWLALIVICIVTYFLTRYFINKSRKQKHEAKKVQHYE